MIAAESGHDVTLGGAVWFSRYADVPQIPASVMKTLTFYVARQLVRDAMLDETVTVAADDLLGGSSADLQAGDVLSWRDLFHGMMMPSGNDAAHCVARVAGALLDGTGDPYERFLDRMNEVCLERRWTGAVVASSSGLDTDSRLTARQVCELLFSLDPFCVQVMGTQRWAGTITGPNARTQVWRHTIKPDGAVPLPEMVAAKGGTLFDPPTANLALLWDDGLGVRHAMALLHSTQAARYTDTRQILDRVPLLRVQVDGQARNVTRLRHRYGNATREIQTLREG